MAIVNKLKFANLSKVNRSSITRAIAAGTLVVRQDGKLDTDNPVNQDYIRRGNDKSTQAKPPDKASKKTDHKQSDNITKIQVDGYGVLSKSSIDIIKVAESVKQLQIKTKKERQELIERKLIEKVFSKLYMVDVNMWRTLGANLSPEIAAIAGIDDNEIIIKVGEAIEKEVYVILGHIKRQMNDFLIGIEAKEVE